MCVWEGERVSEQMVWGGGVKKEKMTVQLGKKINIKMKVKAIIIIMLWLLPSSRNESKTKLNLVLVDINIAIYKFYLDNCSHLSDNGLIDKPFG